MSGANGTGSVIVDGRKIVAAGASALNQGAPDAATPETIAATMNFLEHGRLR